MQDITVDSRVFHFQDGWLVVKYDDMPYYRKQLSCKRGYKRSLNAVDLIVFRPAGKTLYLIESKDYRRHRRTNRIPPAKEFVDKVTDTLTGLVPTMLCSSEITEEVEKIREGVRESEKLRLIYQFEQPAKHSKLFPRVFDPTEIQMKLRQELKCFDPRVLVIESATQNKVAWTVD